MNKQLNKHGIIRLWGIQSGLVLLVAAFCAVRFNAEAAYSSLLAGLVYIIPNVIFAVKLFKYQGARAAKQIVQSFYKAEALKIIISMFLFAMVFISCTIKPAAFFASYVLMLMTHWFAPWIIVNKRKRPKSD